MIGYPSGFHSQIRKALSLPKYVGPKKTPHREFILRPRMDLNNSPEIWASEIYHEFRNYLVKASKSNNEIPLFQVSGAHLHLFQKHSDERDVFLAKFGVEAFVTTQDYDPQWDGEKAPGKIKEKGNSIAETIVESALSAEGIIRSIKNQLQSSANKTPLLLPFENFGERQMQSLRDDIFSLNSSGDTAQKMKRIVAQFNTLNKKYKPPNYRGNKLVYRSKNNVFFNPPGRALHGKAVAKLVNGHEINCWVRGTMRFGAPFRPRFHYDCSHRDLKVLRRLRSCHKQEFSMPKDRQHLNIAPNDNLR